MTIRRLIKQLMDCPMDAQVLDSGGSPIIYMVFNSRENDDVRLEAKEDMDVETELDELFKSAMECGESDDDTFDELCDLGYTLRDLENYNYSAYEWALKINNQKGGMRDE